MRDYVGIILFIVAIFICTILLSNKLYMAIKNGYIESTSNPKKVITGQGYYIRLLLYIILILAGITLVVIFYQNNTPPFWIF